MSDMPTSEELLKIQADAWWTARFVYPQGPVSGKGSRQYLRDRDRAGEIAGVEAIIAAAEPHLRRKHRQELLDELVAKAREKWDDQPMLWKMSLDMYVDWLMEQRKEAE